MRPVSRLTSAHGSCSGSTGGRAVREGGSRPWRLLWPITRGLTDARTGDVGPTVAVVVAGLAVVVAAFSVEAAWVGRSHGREKEDHNCRPGSHKEFHGAPPRRFPAEEIARGRQGQAAKVVAGPVDRRQKGGS